MDKPAGMTSHDVVAIVRRRLGIKAVGHTGTLDPFATGLLVLVIGGATRLARFIAPGLKRYTAVARLGLTTDSDDASGTAIGSPYQGPWPSRNQVEAAGAELVGDIRQTPPAYSAKSVAGVRSYRLARKGKAVGLAPVEVRVEALTVLHYQPPELGFVAEVGPGTYIRAIARDWGAALGTGGHLTALRREQVGRWNVADAVAPDRVERATPLIGPLDLLGEMPRVALTDDETTAVRRGQAVGSAGPDPSVSALVLRDELIAIAEPKAGRWQPTIVVTTG